MSHQEMLEWLIAHPEVSVRRMRSGVYVCWDLRAGLTQLSVGADYQTVIEEAALKLASSS